MAAVRDGSLMHWLALCGLDLPDSSLVLVNAASEDYRRASALRHMLGEPPEDFLRWWHSQDYRDWAMTDVTGNTDWAWLVLARAGQEVSESKFGGL